MTHGPSRHPAWVGVACLAGLSRVERAAAGACSCTDRRRRFTRAAARSLDADLHGQRGAVPRAILPAIPARRAVRQTHGRQRLGRSHRGLHDRAAGCTPGGTGCGARGGIGDLWRREPVRCLLCLGANGPGAVSGCGHSTAADAGGDRAWYLDVHDDGVSGHARHPECHSDAVLWHHAFRSTRSRHYRVGHHAGIWIVVARPSRSDREAGKRGLWWWCRRCARCRGR